jgi:acetyl-CoA C-acetyltransferase
MSHPTQPKENVYIVSGARTPMGGFQGAFSQVPATELGAVVIQETIQRAGITAEAVEAVIMGCVLSAGLKQGPARQAALKAGMPVKTDCTTINKLCGSGMKATMFAHDLIQAGTNQLVISGGMENMTLAPYLIEKARSGLRMGHGEIKDHMFFDGLEDAATGKLMGAFAQDMADKKGLTRAQMDEFAIASLTKAQTAIKEGYFAEEIVPVTIKNKKEEIVVRIDEQPLKAKAEKIPELKAAFKTDGTITAANASSISDGASALLLANETAVNTHQLKPLARIVAHATQSQHPSEFTIAPVGAIQNLLKKTGWDIKEVDLFEINEAFAMVAMVPIIELGIDADKVNIHGGACALGHPVGSTGSRIILSLIYALKRLGKKKGVAALCIGGGEATAVAIELCE